MSSHDGIFEGAVELYIRDKTALENLMNSLKKLNGIETVKRLEILDQTKE
jgi:(p)ppGpp synthase/HD superfamily hydrolase